MEQKNYLKLVWIVAFVAFAAVSCWATAESLHLLLSTWPKILCWVVTVGFFIIASLGTKMIVDSLNQNIYLEKRGLRLVGGIIMLLIFWLVCSMPTNTHTFFYRTVINDKVKTDISVTRGYLTQIKNNQNNVNQARIKVNELKRNVDVKLRELEEEIKNEVNPGFGPKSQEILRQIAALLGVAKIEPFSLRKGVLSDSEKIRLCDAYRQKIYALAENVANNIVAHIASPGQDVQREVKRDIENLNLLEKYINDKTIDLNDAEGIENVCDKLNSGYTTIRKNRVFVNFDPKSDEEKYTAPNAVTDVKRMVSVVDVWSDFLNGKYSGYGFAFWIFISILVDVAAFIFFDLAFRKTND